MEISKTAKLQIYPNVDESHNLIASMHAYSAACNFVSHYVFSTKDLSQVSVQKNTYIYIRDKYKLPSQMACNVVRTVIGSYQAIKSNNQAWTECKYTRPQLTLSWNRDYSLTKTKFSINTIYGRIKVSYASAAMVQYFDKIKYRFGAAKVVYSHNKFFLHITVSYSVPTINDSTICNVVGHDRGIRFLAVSYGSTGKTNFINGGIVKQIRGRYVTLRSQLQQIGTPSSRRRLKAIGQRENRWMRDVNHCISKALVENNPEGTLHVIEDLKGIRSAITQIKHKNNYVMISWPYYDLEQKLIYKAAEHGQKVIKVDPRYTSQTCPHCGHVERANRNHIKHIFQCMRCGYTSNDDRIGAMNLYRKGIEYLIESQISKSDL